jgi:hypothetical protein
MLDTFNEATLRAQDRYRGFLTGLRGALAEISTTDARDMRALLQLRQRGAAMAETYLQAEHDLYRQDLYAVQLAADAAAQTDLTGQAQDVPWDDAGDLTADWYIHELGAQAWRDINTVVHARRQQAFAPAFTFMDRRGRVFGADQHIAQIARHGLVLFGVQTYATSAAALGASQVSVTHPDPSHKHAGMAVNIEDLEGILSEVFHPNSRAFLKAEAA